MSQFWLCLDTETGGLNPDKADLLTAFFAIMDEEFKIHDELYLKLKPDGRLPIAEAGALKVNGINIQEHLADPETVTYAEGNKLLTAMVKKHLKKRGRYSNIKPMIYNAAFDTKWVQKHLLSMDEWDSMLHYKITDPMQNVDFLKECGWFPPELGSLNSVVEYLQIPKRDAHNAREDVLMMIDVHKKILELMKSKKNGSGSTEQQDLISLLETE